MLDFLRSVGVVITRARNVDPEERMNVVLSRELVDVDLFVDVGANRGQSYKRVRGLNYLESYLAIEPEEVCFSKLLEIGRLDNDFFTKKCAVGEYNGKVQLNVANNDALSSSILEFSMGHLAAAPEIRMVGAQEVPLMTLSTILSDFNQSDIFLKIDVQGFEIDVLKGIESNDWSRIRGALIECNLVDTYIGSSLMEDVFLVMRNKGFFPFRLENGFGEPNFGQQLQVDVLFKRSAAFEKLK